MKNKTLQSIVVLVVAIILIVLGIVLGHHFASAPAVTPPTNQAESDTPEAPRSLVTINPLMVAATGEQSDAGVSGAFPQFPQADNAFNKKIASQVSGDIMEYQQNALDNEKVRAQANAPSLADSGSSNSLSITTTLVQSNENYISCIIREEGYTGGAHPYHTAVTYNYDVKNHKQLSLTDFVSLLSVSNQSRTILAKKLANAANETTLDDTTKSMLYDGTSPSAPQNFNAFTFTATDITIYFPEYQVAPYVYGEQSVTIPKLF